MNLLRTTKKRILVTGGAGFIGRALIRSLLLETNSFVINLDKLSYASDLKQIESLLKEFPELESRYLFYKFDLCNDSLIDNVIREIDPDFIFHLAAESHVDRSIEGPKIFLESNINGTFNLLQASMKFWEDLPLDRKNNFCFQHISTDEVYGSLGDEGAFDEKTPYAPRSPYAASKAASDHLVNAWHHTYGFPTIITNCSNNFGPWQFPEKLIPLAILKALSWESIPMYGTGLNIRDWLFIDDHIRALLLIASKGIRGSNYCIGGYGQKTNYQVIKFICSYLDKINPQTDSYLTLITSVEDRPGHDFRYAINSQLITKELGWKPIFTFEEGLTKTIEWYYKNIDWVRSLHDRDHQL